MCLLMSVVIIASTEAMLKPIAVPKGKCDPPISRSTTRVDPSTPLVEANKRGDRGGGGIVRRRISLLVSFLV